MEYGGGLLQARCGNIPSPHRSLTVKGSEGTHPILLVFKPAA